MLTKKAEKLQIRIESELLQRLKSMSHRNGVHVSVMLRHILNSACRQHEDSLARKDAWRQKQLEKKK